MYALILILHLLICFSLIGVVLIQSGKGGGLAGGAFGGSAQTVFGGRGATDFITRATMILGGLFFVTSLVLAMMSSGLGRAPRSVLQREARPSSTAPSRSGGPPTLPGTSTPTPPAGTKPATPPAPNPGTPPGGGGR